MSLINEKVIEEFAEWAKENEDRKIFPEISENENSYYIDRKSEDTYMTEYSFKTVAELKKELEKYSGLPADSQILKKLTVEICQNRFRSKLEMNVDNKMQSEKVNDGKKTLPEFIYVF